MTWHGDDKLQFNTQANIVNTFLVRVPDKYGRGWRYYGVPPAVTVILCSLWNEQVEKKPDDTGVV